MLRHALRFTQRLCTTPSFPMSTLQSWSCNSGMHACMYHIYIYIYMLGPRRDVLIAVFSAASLRGRRPRSMCTMSGQLLLNMSRFGDGDPNFISQKATWYTYSAKEHVCMHANCKNSICLWWWMIYIWCF